MSSVQTVYIQYTQLKRAVNPPRKKMAAGEADAPGGAAKKRTAFAARACGFAVPPGMLILVCRPRSQPRSAARYAYFGLPPARLRVRPSAVAYSSSASPAARALAGSPFCKRNGENALPCRPRACGFAAPPGMLILVCRPRSQPRSAARNVCFSPAAHACGFAALPGMLILVCRPRSQPRSAARYVCFSPAARALVGSPRPLVLLAQLPHCRPRTCGFAGR